jgi:predicted DNA-binding transcriptional regulator AlpA
MAVRPEDAAVPELTLVQDRAGNRPSRGESTYWDIEDLQFHCRIGRSTAWRLVRRDDFPSPVVFNPRGVLWPREEVIAFMEQHREPDHYRRGDRAEAPHRREPAFSSRPTRRRSG